MVLRQVGPILSQTPISSAVKKFRPKRIWFRNNVYPKNMGKKNVKKFWFQILVSHVRTGQDCQVNLDQVKLSQDRSSQVKSDMSS